MCWVKRVLWACGCIHGTIPARYCDHYGTDDCEIRHLLERLRIPALCEIHERPQQPARSRTRRRRRARRHQQPAQTAQQLDQGPEVPQLEDFTGLPDVPELPQQDQEHYPAQPIEPALPVMPDTPSSPLGNHHNGNNHNQQVGGNPCLPGLRPPTPPDSSSSPAVPDSLPSLRPDNNRHRRESPSLRASRHRLTRRERAAERAARFAAHGIRVDNSSDGEVGQNGNGQGSVADGSNGQNGTESGSGELSDVDGSAEGSGSSQ
ncbi:hypothetical protein B0J18DRAFT_300859 [Chaetomium sp. MPI-SDFR-AT-0129]|nr:hypothetical protein B0J18DRAFT_300859 [Chaetomium sp. MPI-SDFR-AT-0129]